MRENSNIIILNEELVRAGMKGGFGIKRQQIKALGEAWPPKAGWLESAIGKEITEDKYKWFLKCGGNEFRKPKRKNRSQKPNIQNLK